jgi:DNA recombination protein RmuC
MNTFEFAILILVVLSLMLQIVLVLRKSVVDFSPLQQSLENFEKLFERMERTVRSEIVRGDELAGNEARRTREELQTVLKNFNDSILKGMIGLSENNLQQIERLKTGIEERLKTLQDDNTRQLDKMRETVDEKLQSTLEKRLGESFKQVGERLEQVYKGLGEMQSLAAGVGDLKRVLTNVKTRGTWGEVQLGALLEQVLNRDQYEVNVATKGTGERVEFAIRLPGRSGDRGEVVWLPIDAKFPVEDYQRLLDAQERGDAAGAESAAGQLEVRIKLCAKDISEKYIAPPKTTDFGILFLPTEGLFAEVLRRPGLAEFVQNQHRVVVAGPTTIWSILSSLQMGFRTLAIEQRSSEVWNLLAAVKTEWTRYGDMLGKVQKKLQEASNTVDDAAQRTRAIGRKLRGVQELPAEQAAPILNLEAAMGSDEE